LLINILSGIISVNFLGEVLRRMKKFAELKNKISFFYLILILSPFVDLIISIIQNNFSGIAFLGSAVRGLLLVGVLVYTFFYQKNNNKKIMNYLIIIMLFMFLFIIYKNITMTEIKGVIKFFFFPLILGCFLMHKEDVNKIKNSIYLSGVIYMILLLIPLITGTSYNTYNYMKAGSIGWFYSPNEISAIVSLIFPFMVLKVLDTENNKYKIIHLLITSLYIYSIFSIGTKVPVFSVIITFILFLVITVFKLFINKKTNKINIKNLSFILILIMFSIFTFKNGLALNNILLQNNRYENTHKVENPNKPNANQGTQKPNNNEEINKPDNGGEKDPNQGNNETELPEISIEDNYSNLLQDYFPEIIIKEEKDEYVSNKIINLIFSSRDIYFMRKLTAWNQSNILDKIFGMGLSYEFNDKITQKLIEIDFVDIFFCYGIVGFIIYFGLIIYLIWKFIIYFFKNFESFVNDYTIYTYYITIALSILISCVAGHILGAPSVSLLLAIVIATIYNKLFVVKLEKYKFLKLKRILIIIIALIGCIGISLFNKYYIENTSNKINLIYKDNKISAKGLTKHLKLVEEKDIKSNYAKDNLKYYVVKDGKNEILRLLMITRTFDNDINFVYFTGQNITDEEYEITITNKNNVNEASTFKEKEIIKEYSTTVGYDKKTLPSLYATSDNYYTLIYKTYIYNIKEKKYNDTNYSILKELIKEDNSITLKKNKVINQFTLNSTNMFDSLIIDSSKKLFNNPEEVEDFIDLINNNKSSAWQAFDGAYTKLPYSIEPYTKEGYGRNIGSIVEEDMYRLFNKTGNKFFECYVLLSLHTLSEYIPQNTYGVWLTEYTSTWLKKDYQIKALYFDTRHNDTIAYYLSTLAEHYNNNELRKWSHYYAEYLLYEHGRGNETILKEGVLTPDYFSTHHNENTHTSLNHQLAIINYLLRSFIQTDKTEYKDLALKYLSTIEKIGTDWIKENKDLYYQINAKGEFKGIDYTTLTLEDLLVTQGLLEEIGNKKSKVLDKLINSKYQYLKDINHNISSYLKNELKEGGYIE